MHRVGHVNVKLILYQDRYADSIIFVATRNSNCTYVQVRKLANVLGSSGEQRDPIHPASYMDPSIHEHVHVWLVAKLEVNSAVAPVV